MVLDTAGNGEKITSRGRIIAAAKTHFAAHGYEGASTRKIAEEVGVAQSLLLYHFETKDDLWKSVMDLMFAEYEVVLQSALDTENEDAADKLKAIIIAFVDYCRNDPDLHRVMVTEGRSSTDRLAWLIENHVRRGYDLTISLIKQGQKDGTVRRGDPRLVYYSIIAIAGTIYSLEPEMHLLDSNKSRPKRDTVVDYMCNLIFTDA